jgi:hypothetical protein
LPGIGSASWVLRLTACDNDARWPEGLFSSGADARLLSLQGVEGVGPARPGLERGDLFRLDNLRELVHLPSGADSHTDSYPGERTMWRQFAGQRRLRGGRVRP